MFKPHGRVDPELPSRRHDGQRLLEGEALAVVGDEIFAHKLLTLHEIVCFLEQWWSEAAVAPVHDRFEEISGFEWDEVPEVLEDWRKEATDGTYSDVNLAASIGLRRGVRLGRALHSTLEALSVQDFVHETIGSLNRGPVMARAEHEWASTLVEARRELEAIFRDPEASEIGRDTAQHASALLAVLDDADDPVVAGTWPVQRKNLVEELNKLEWLARRRYFTLPPDPPAPARATDLFRQILDYRFEPTYSPVGDESLRLAYADAIEEHDPALATFVRRQIRRNEPGWFEEEHSRFHLRIPGFMESMPVAALSPWDVERWVMDVGPYVEELSFERGLVSTVRMTFTQLIQHGASVLGSAPIVGLYLVLRKFDLSEALAFLRTSEVFVPIRELRLSPELLHYEGVVQLLSNPHFANMRSLTIEPWSSYDHKAIETAAALTHFVNTNRDKVPDLELHVRFEGSEILVLSRRVKDEKDSHWSYRWTDRESPPHPGFDPPAGSDRWELSARGKRLEAKYGPLPWLRFSQEKRKALLREWASMIDESNYSGTSFWRYD